jgi:uncharacterized protein YuzE
MKITIGKYASYVQIKPSISKGDVAYTREIGDGLYADYSEEGLLLGIEYQGTPEVVKED